MPGSQSPGSPGATAGAQGSQQTAGADGAAGESGSAGSTDGGLERGDGGRDMGEFPTGDTGDRVRMT